VLDVGDGAVRWCAEFQRAVMLGRIDAPARRTPEVAETCGIGSMHASLLEITCEPIAQLTTRALRLL